MEGVSWWLFQFNFYFWSIKIVAIDLNTWDFLDLSWLNKKVQSYWFFNWQDFYPKDKWFHGKAWTLVFFQDWLFVYLWCLRWRSCTNCSPACLGISINFIQVFLFSPTGTFFCGGGNSKGTVTALQKGHLFLIVRRELMRLKANANEFIWGQVWAH